MVFPSVRSFPCPYPCPCPWLRQCAGGGERLAWEGRRGQYGRGCQMEERATDPNKTTQSLSSLHMDASCSPAHRTKHIPLLSYTFANIPFRLNQLDNGASNGTTLWLGGQCLALYLAECHTKYKSPGHAPRAIELGSGIGLTAYANTPGI
jgi:hypothetical protein